MNKFAIKLLGMFVLNFATLVETTSWLSAASDFLFFAGLACLAMLIIADVTFIKYLLKSQGKKEPHDVGQSDEKVESEEHF